MRRHRSANDSRRPVAVVTGASAGVGRATAIALARAGHDVALLARSDVQLESARRQVASAGARASVFPVDVADAGAVFAAADEVARRWGGIDVWVNNAMATIFAPVDDVTPAEFRRVTEVTYLGQVHGTLAALKHMRRCDRGTIVQVGSALSYRAIPLQSAYCGAKFAVRGFTDSLRSELIHQGSRIRLTMVQLPAVDTPQFDWARSRLPRRLQPVPPIYQPEAIAAAIVKAARSAPRELWIGWPSIRAILGTMLMPGLLDRLAAKTAWDGQMTAEPARSDREDDLFAPAAVDPGIHGRFTRQSRGSVRSASSAAIRAAIGTLALGAAVMLVAAAAGAQERKPVARR